MARQRAAVIGIIAIGSYKLTTKSIGKDILLWSIFVVLAATTFITEQEIIGLILAGGFITWWIKAPPKNIIGKANLFAPFILQIPFAYSDSKLFQVGWFFTKAGAFVFGSGLAIVPFLYGGVVKEFHWLTEKEFVDAVAVAMITPGPVVITVGFIGYLVDGFWGSVFLPAPASAWRDPYLLPVVSPPSHECPVVRIVSPPQDARRWNRRR